MATSTTLPKLPREPSRPGDALLRTDGVMRCLAATFVSWMFIGAIGHTTSSLEDSSLPLVIVGFFCCVKVIFLVGLSIEAEMAWPRSYGVYMKSATLGFGATTVSALLFSVWDANACLGIFWSLSGIYIGMMVEAFTGVSHRARATWAATIETR